jgi:hypothetical protein
VNGVATFTNLKITGTGNHTLTFTAAGGLTAATSITVNVAELNCALGGSCILNDTGPGGGKVFYISTLGFKCGPTFASTCHYLEVAPKTWSGSEDPIMRWDYTIWSDETLVGYPKTLDPHLDDSEIGLGYKNSGYLFTLYGNNSEYAAGAARRYTGGEKSDWYLGTAVEMNLLCDWSQGLTSTPDVDCRSVKFGLGGFGTVANPSVAYWTSSAEVARPENAYNQNFATGGAGSAVGHKSFVAHVRPIRSF